MNLFCPVILIYNYTTCWVKRRIRKYIISNEMEINVEKESTCRRKALNISHSYYTDPSLIVNQFRIQLDPLISSREGNFRVNVIENDRLKRFCNRSFT